MSGGAGFAGLWRSHPAVAEAAAIGIPDPLKGEIIKVFVQTREAHAPCEALAAQLIEHVRRELGPIATPARLEFVTALPKTRSGKILRRLLKAKETGADAGDVSTLEGCRGMSCVPNPRRKPLHRGNLLRQPSGP
jgi:acetyl-CoA synthetase